MKKPILLTITALVFTQTFSPTLAHARYYDAEVGRFVSPDTIVPSEMDPQSLNRYAYVRNNPVVYTDPDGHAFFIAPILIVAGVFAASSATMALFNGANRSGIWTAAWQGGIQGAGFALGSMYGGPILGGIVSGGLGGAMTGGVEGAMQGAAFGGFTAGISSYIPVPQNTAGAIATRIGVGAGIGGGMSALMGGSFRDGATQGAMYSAVSMAYSAGMNGSLRRHYSKEINRIGSDSSQSFQERSAQIQSIYTKAGQMGLKLKDYRMVELTESPQTHYRVWGGASPEGRFISPEKYGSRIEADQLNALPPWNLATNVSEVIVGPGTTIKWGISMPAYSKPGGGVEGEIIGGYNNVKFGKTWPLQ